MAEPSPSADSLVSLRLAHLSMLQNIISRLAGNSATVKNFCLSLATAATALAVAENFGDLLWGAAALIVLFGALDAYYLSLERAFRTLYATVAARPLGAAADLSIEPGTARLLPALASLSVWLFYLPQLGLVLAVALLR